jgi:hypothetical protein
MKKNLHFSQQSKTWAILLIALVSFAIFFKIGGYNYEVQKVIQRKIVEHPESLPTKEMAKFTSFWMRNVRADWYRLRTIQYIGWNAISSEYKKYLYKILELVTGLNPYFEHPYVIGELLLPSYNDRYEKLEKSEKERNLKEAEKIGLLGIQNFCDTKKIRVIKDEYNLQKLWTDSAYKDPCLSYEIPFYLAYVYYFYKHEPLSAAWYYKVASANTSAPEWAKVMSAIMQGKWGSREKSIFMFLNLAKNFEKNDISCQQFTYSLEEMMAQILDKKAHISANLVENIQILQGKIFGSFDEKKELKILGDTTCQNYVLKAIREINLLYIEEANEGFKEKHAGESASTAKVLYDEKYISFLPTDFQVYKDGNSIIYEYNPDTKNFDYSMGKYGISLK